VSKPAKKHLKALAPDPWGLDRANPFDAPWRMVPLGSRIVGERRTSIKAGVLHQYATLSLAGTEYHRAASHCRFLCDIVNACTDVCGNWDYKSFQQIIPLFEMSLELGKVIADLKQENPDVLGDWWRDLSKDDRKAFKDIESFLKIDWPPAQQAEFTERQQEASRQKYFKYKREDDILSDHLVGQDGNPILYFSLFSESRLPALSQSTRFNVAAELTAGHREKIRSSRYAFWQVILETANVFRHLDEQGSALPSHWPRLVANMRLAHAPLSKLGRALQKRNSNMSSRLSRLSATMDQIFDCFDSTKDRNRAFAELSPRDRKEAYKVRRDVYRQRAPQKPSPSGHGPHSLPMAEVK